MFDRLMPQPNRTDRVHLHVRVLRDDLLKIHKGTKTEAGVRLNIRSAYNISMPGCAAAARCRSTSHGRRGDRQSPARGLAMDQIRRRARGRRESNRRVFPARAQARDASGQARGRGGDLRVSCAEAIKLFRELSLSREFVPFLTIPAYELMLTGSFIARVVRQR